MKLFYKFRDNLITSGLYFLYLFVSCVMVMLVEALLVYVVDKFVVLSYFALTIMRVVIYTLGVTALMGLWGYAEGYKEEECRVGETVAAYIPAMILHLLFAMLFKFQGFVSGSVRFTAGLVVNGQGINADNLVNVTPYWMFLAMFAGYGVLYFAVFTIAKYVGAKQRIIVRGEIRKGENIH